MILPVSFFSLSLASRYTHASNVSLLLLLETVLGPLWVWLGVGEEPTPMMLVGGVIVVGSLAVYLMAHRAAPARVGKRESGHGKNDNLSRKAACSRRVGAVFR